ncbi:MAG: hypothetical protein WKF89_10290 [Chitinophagaceae bacterium]
MDQQTREFLDNLHSTNPDQRYTAFQHVIAVTQQRVDWSYHVWDELITMLRNGDNHQRSIAAQVLSNLAKSDPEKRMLQDMDDIIIVTKDVKFVTARHSLQSLWKIAIASKELQEKVLDILSKRFSECVVEKNATLIRYDILEVFKKTYDVVGDEKIKELSLALIEKEQDPKYRKKYSGLWKGAFKSAGKI